MIIVWLIDFALLCAVAWLGWTYIVMPTYRWAQRVRDRTDPNRGVTIIKEALIGQKTAAAKREAAKLDRETQDIDSTP